MPLKRPFYLYDSLNHTNSSSSYFHMRLDYIIIHFRGAHHWMALATA
nr:MAG TPA: hypothetical protein [Caudoviricetes sp.]